MKTMINQLNKLRPFCLGMLAALATCLSTKAVPYTNFLSLAETATYLVSAPLTDVQVQTRHAQNFNQLPPSSRPLYLHAVAFQIGHIVATGEPLGAAALAGYLQTADPDQFFDIDFPLPEDDEQLVIGALREINMLLANQIAAIPAYQRAIQWGAVNGYTFPTGGGTGSLLLPTSGSTENLNNLDDWNEFHSGAGQEGAE